MDLKVGMYVRTKNHNGFPGGIGKIEKIEDDETHKTSWITLDCSLDGRSFLVMKQEIVKASHTLLGNEEEPCLIEVGDYINNYPVVEITNHQILGKIVCTNSPCDWNINEEKIKSIVTKEQFVHRSYKIS